jgi:hypothetical protein
LSSPRAKRSFFGFRLVDRNGFTTIEGAAALDDIADQLDQFEFAAKTGQATSTAIASAGVVLSGAQNETWPFTIRGGTSPGLSLDNSNWYPWVIARAGDTLYARQTSSGSGSTTTTVTIYGPGRSATFSVTTA